MSHISYTNYYVPKHSISVQEALTSSTLFTLPKEYDCIEDFCREYSNRHGLREVYVEQQYELIDIIDELVQRMFNESDIKPSDIKFIIFTDRINEITKDGVSIPYYIQHKFGMSESAIIALDQKCSTTLLGMGIAHSLLSKSSDDKILILSSCMIHENEKRYIDFTICGDGAAVMLLEPGKLTKAGFKIIDFLSVSDGSFSYNKQLVSQSKNDKHSFTNIDERMLIIQKGMNTIKLLLAKNELSLEDVRIIIPQSVSEYAYYMYAMILGYPFKQFYIENVKQGGHLGDVDTIRNYKDVTERHTFSQGDYIVLYGLGSDGTDMNYSTVLLQYQA